MNNWTDDNTETVCQSDQNRESAQTVCHKLNIEFKELNFVKSYWNHVFRFCLIIQFFLKKFKTFCLKTFSYLLESYKKGETPNPDIMCNKFVKFGSFVSFCLNQLKVDAIATGHYAGTTFGNFWQHYHNDRPVRLLRPKDKIKDQTLFLSQLSQNSLRKVMFPLQYLLKSEVKSIAKQNGFQTIAERPEVLMTFNNSFLLIQFF